jgi:hypothetical protein
MGNIADISDAYAASIFSVEECRMGEFLCTFVSSFEKPPETGRVGVGGLSGPIESMDRKSCAKTEPALLKAAEYTKRPLAFAVLNDLF